MPKIALHTLGIAALATLGNTAAFADADSPFEIAASALNVPVATTFARQPRIADRSDFGVFGFGINQFTGDSTNNRCVLVDSILDKIEPSGANGHTKESNTAEVTTITDIRTQSGFSGSASLVYKAFSIGASGSINNGSVINSYTRYALFKRRVVYRTEIAEGPRPTKILRVAPEFLTVLRTAGKDAFREKCGDAFVSRVVYGGNFMAIATVKATMDSNWKSNQGKLSLGIAAIFGGSASTSNDYQEMKKVSSENVIDLVEAGVNIDTKVENLRSSYDGFETAVANNLIPISYELTPYSALIDIRHNELSTLSQELMAALEQLADQKAAARQNINDIDQALASPDLFTTAESDLRTAKGNLSAFLLKVAKAVDDCEVSKTGPECVQAVMNAGTAPIIVIKAK